MFICFFIGLKKFRIAILFIATLCASLSQAAPLYSEKDLALAKRAMAAAQTSDLAWDLVASLTTEVGPRPAGTANDAKAIAWAKSKLTSLGFDRVWTEPVKVDAWIGIEAHAAILSPHPQTLAVAALGNSISTPAEGLTGEIAYFENFDQLKRDTTDRARGRIVFIDSVFVRTREGTGYGKAVPARGGGAVEAGRRGALAVVIRSIGSDHDRLPHTGAMRYDEKIAPPIPAAAVSNPDADMIARQVKSGKPVTLSLMLKNSLVKGAESQNVLAEIRGADNDKARAAQVVAIGGHLDSWGLGTGAIDDGAGVAITVAAAKILKDSGIRPRRTIRVILFANEENGLDGAKAYAAAHGRERHQLVAESDLGADIIYRIGARVDAATQPWIRAIAEVIAPLGIEFSDAATDTGADMSPMVREHAAPAVALKQDATRYFDYHHTANDTLDKIDPVQLKQNVAAWAAMVWLAAQADADFAPSPAK